MYKNKILITFFMLVLFSFKLNASNLDSLTLYNPNTGEKLKIYFFEKKLVNYKRREIDNFFRDFRHNEVKRVNSKLLNYLYYLVDIVGAKDKVIQIHSGYRNQATNRLLKKQKNRYVAYDSRHLRANAIDFTIPDVDMGKVFYIARRLRIGGVGYYKKSNFVHIDIEGHRVWSY